MRGLRSILIILLVLVCAINVSAQAQWLSSLPTVDSSNTPLVSGDLQPVIVEFDLPFRPEGELPSQAKGKQRRDIAQVQSQLRQQLRDLGIHPRNTKEFKTIPFIALTLSQAEILEMENLPIVKQVQPDHISFPSLDSSTPVIGVPEAQAHGYDGEGQVVAVLDSGVDYDHTHFTDKVVAEGCYSTVDSFTNANVHSACPGGVLSSTAAGSGINCTDQASSWPSAQAFCFHGTHVAGIAVGDDPDGPYDGVAPAAGLMPIQIFSVIEYTGVGGNPCGRNATCISAFGSDLIAALEQVLTEKQAGTDIVSVNMSLGGGLYTDESLCDSDNAAVKTAIDNLRSENVATIIATGNNSSRTWINAPGCISTAVAVGATDNIDNIASFSNISPLLEVLAPGWIITSAFIGPGTNSDVVASSGTSMATPHVAGAWAVLKQQDPTATVDNILSRLIENGTPVDDSRSGGVQTDMPRINVDLSFKMDFGDSPLPYPVLVSENGPQHCTSPDLRLGALATSHDFPILRNATATADDDDGVSDLQLISKGNATVLVEFNNQTENDAQLVCWGDWNQDGDFTDSGERSQPALFGTTVTTLNAVDFHDPNSGSNPVLSPADVLGMADGAVATININEQIVLDMKLNIVNGDSFDLFLSGRTANGAGTGTIEICTGSTGTGCGAVIAITEADTDTTIQRRTYSANATGRYLKVSRSFGLILLDAGEYSPATCGPGSVDSIFATGNIAAGCSGITRVLWTARAATPPVDSDVFTRCRISDATTFFSDSSPEDTGDGGNGEVEDTLFNAPPTAVTIGQIELIAVTLEKFMTILEIDAMDSLTLLTLLQSWAVVIDSDITEYNRDELIAMLRNYLDPDGDGRLAMLRWDTLEERGTIGFYVERQLADGSWKRVNDDMLPGLITAPMGGEYILADPKAGPVSSYFYRLIEQEATGRTRNYGPFKLEMP